MRPFTPLRNNLASLVKTDLVPESLPRYAGSVQHFYRNKVLDGHVHQKATPITLRQLIFYERHRNTKRILASANYVRTELPIRLSHRIREFQNLPFIVGTNPFIQDVYDLYWKSFERLRTVPPITTLAENEDFCGVLRGTLEDHRVVIPRLALGISECLDHISSQRLDAFMNSTLKARISRRVLAEQHLVMSHVGTEIPISIFSSCSAHATLETCKALVMEHYPEQSKVPQVIVGEGEKDSKDTEFTYVSEQIQYILYQLLSNAVRHTIKHHSNAAGSYPPIKVTVCSNSTDVFFRISDRGGGILPEVYKSLWSYGVRNQIFGNFKHIPQHTGSVAEHSHDVPLGIGLPMSRAYAEYWGGEINVVTMDGWGTDAYVRIPKLGTQIENIDVEPTDEHAVLDSAHEGPTPCRLAV
ncbi:branched-chain alpha-ketoacid dehydrogenase kinase [Phycomyces blakesleeanus]|uniref:Protein-serine/threonine kinase n=2 Tax=Phycomyces blakesleeanus TaxID=4837 RepID=A0A162WMQ4_PHYB8|nr:hypothetical protein PHYBLDRAFT_149526 [Phycomyces blakesleeanus NRRL 1555(-)]OAD69125.1 hypothetical protein PHYBLDRAFT_149526 [Phycomyces blakesleeanus NRRL 1555(-)]|eukprot:XP_018287165.1 hypothetical protein PHYBLDRAFT_149526 [Phycomyces blakesleeanus NRRL 1555(-)]